MHLDNKDTIKMSELIRWVKKELLSDNEPGDDSIPLFVIDEVTVEVNFVVSGEGNGEFDLQVVKAGAKVAEERVQKAIVRMKPIVPYERVRERLEERHLRHLEDRAVKVLVKGMTLSEQDVPSRE